MRAIIIAALIFALAGFAISTHHTAPTVQQQLPAGVTTDWPIDPRDPETTCGIGIHFEDTFALTDAQLDTARRYVAHECWGAPLDGSGAEHAYYYHH